MQKNQCKELTKNIQQCKNRNIKITSAKTNTDKNPLSAKRWSRNLEV